MSSTDTTAAKPTIERQRQLDRYPGNADLIPLNPPGRKIKMPNGKIVAVGKAPLHSGWQKRPYDPIQVVADALANGNNLGLRLHDDQLVLDVDVRAGGLEGLSCMAFDFDIDLGKYPTVITPTGGQHICMSIPKGTLVRDTLESEVYKGVECKSRGRQVVAAGSTHPDGGMYEWDLTKPSLLDGWPPAPKKLLTMIKRPPRSAVAGGGQYTNDDIAKMLATMPPEDFQDQTKWLQLMQACHHASSGEARFEFVQWSITDPKYADDADLIGRRWDSLNANKNDGITYATLRMFVHEHGDGSTIPAEGIGDDFDDGMYTDEHATSLAPVDSFDNGWRPSGTDDEWMNAGEVADDPLRRGLKVNAASVAKDTFKNAFAAMMTSGLTVAFNDMSKAVEFIGDVPWNVGEFGRVLDDKVLAMVRLFVIGKYQGNDFDPNPKHLADAIHALAYSNRFNPVADYLASVEPTWDGVSRVEHLFGRYFNCGDDAYTRGVSKAFAVGAVRRIRKPGSKFDTVPVLKSPQGWNKSTALRTLFGDRYYSDSPLGSLTNKDAAMKLRGLWVCELAEIESLRKHEVNTLKAFMSQQIDRQRDPYERLTADVPRSNVFAATVNEGGYLGDQTGGRRFWPLEVTKPIDLDKLAADRNQIWSEAAAMESAGESDVLPMTLWQDAAARQEAETLDDPWEDILRTYLAQRAAQADDGAVAEDDEFGGTPLPPDKVHTSELFAALHIEDKDQSRALTNRLRSVMVSRLGWQHKKAVRINDAIRAGYDRP